MHFICTPRRCYRKEQWDQKHDVGTRKGYFQSHKPHISYVEIRNFKKEIFSVIFAHIYCRTFR